MSDRAMSVEDTFRLVRRIRACEGEAAGVALFAAALREAADAARREEREALNELLRTEAASWPELGAALLFKVQGLLDARSRAEEPKP